MRVNSTFSAGLLALAVWTAGYPAYAQFVAPQNSLSFEDKGTLEAIQGDAMQMRDSKSEPWLLRIGADTTVTVEGDAERCLHPGLFVQFTGKINRRASGRAAHGGELPQRGKLRWNFPPDDKEASSPSVRRPLGLSRQGKLATFRDDSCW
jgi:hypothetical protein